MNTFLNKTKKIYGSKDLWKFFNNSLVLDTLELARLKWFDLTSYNLGTVANELGFTLKDAHRALPDTIANAKVLLKMLEHLRGFGAEKKEYKKRKFDFNI